MKLECFFPDRIVIRIGITFAGQLPDTSLAHTPAKIQTTAIHNQLLAMLALIFRTKENLYLKLRSTVS